MVISGLIGFIAGFFTGSIFSLVMLYTISKGDLGDVSDDEREETDDPESET